MQDDKTVLTGEKLEQAVRAVNVAWAVLPGKGLVRVVPTTGFSSGFAVVTGIAKIAEQYHHNPELTLRRDEVEITLNTYQSGGITSADIVMAQAIDAFLG